MEKKLKYNLQGYMIEFDKESGVWTWIKWEYKDKNGEKKLFSHSGTLQFKKMFKSVFSGGKERLRARTYQDIEKALKESGVDFIFLFQGPTREENRFKSIEEAHRFHKLDSCPTWDLTDYWFGFDKELNSWAMYDAFTGARRFTPDAVLSQPTRKMKPVPPQKAYITGDYIYHDSGATVH